MKSRLFCLLFLLAAPGSQGAEPGDPPEILAWRCWYDQKIHITCLMESAPQAGAAAMAAPSYLPAVIQELRNAPEAFRGRFLHIPLYTESEDMAFTARLARATVCGSRADCVVNFSAVPPSIPEMEELLTRGFPAVGPNPGNDLPESEPVDSR